MKKSTTTQELVNIYPDWAKVRSDDQSIGYQLFNALAKPMEDMDKQLERMKKNQFLASVNLDEIDLAYRVALSGVFEFELDESDPVNPIPIAPTIEGLVNGSFVSVDVAEHNDIRSFWYDSIPNRATLESTASGDFMLLNQVVLSFPWSGVAEHHLIDEDAGGGRIWVETDGGIQYVVTNDLNQLQRGRVTLRGITRKGSEEEETIVFPWDEKQPSQKEWKKLTYVDVWDIESGVNVTIRSADFNAPPYWSSFNLRVSANRTKVDEFWAINEDDATLLDRVGLITDEWQQAILGFSDTEAKESWELLTDDLDPVTAVDLAVQPFTDRAWIVTADKQLYCYDLSETMPSGIQELSPRSAGPEVQLEIEDRHITLGEDIVFTPWHARPLKEISRYRIWYQDPNGDKFGLLDGATVAYASDFWAFAGEVKRALSAQITLTPDQRGEYLLVLETDFMDGTSESDRAIVMVQSKTPLASLDLTSLVSGTVLGIDFDSDQRMWIRTASVYYQIGLHADVCLIDYANKILYFKENYDSVRVT